MTYEELLMEAETHELIVKQKLLKAYKGRIKGNRIAIKKISPLQIKNVHWLKR